MRRITIVAAVAAVLTGVFAAPAYAAAENKVWVDGTQLRYDYFTGAPPTHAVIRNSGETFTVDDAWGIVAGPGCWYSALPDGSVVSCTGITGYRIETGKEDDYVDVLLSGTHTNDRGVILVGAGNDTVWGGNGGEKILGQDGDDFLVGWGSGGTGFNLISGGPGADRIIGGATGNDIVYYDASPVGVTVDLDGAAGDDGAPGEGDTIGADIDGVVGSPFDDTLTGNALHNILIGCAGSDRLDGLDGEHQRLTAVALKGVVGDLELPVAGVLRGPRLGQPHQALVVHDAPGRPLDDHVEPGLPGVVAGRERAAGVPGQVDALLLLGTGAEVQGAVVPHRRQRGHVRAPVRADRGEPEQLGVVDGASHLLPRGCHRVRVAEAGIELGHRVVRGHGAPFLVAPLDASGPRNSSRPTAAHCAPRADP